MPAAQEQAPAGGLKITILDGDDAIVNVRQRVSREAIVQVEDENRKPVAGALVTFISPDNGASAVFANGQKTITLTADANGRVTLSGIRPNQVAGRYQIRIVANSNGLRGTGMLSRTNLAPAVGAAAGISAKVWAIILAGAAAGAVGGVVATRGGSSTAAPAPVTVTPGTVSVGPPR